MRSDDGFMLDVFWGSGAVCSPPHGRPVYGLWIRLRANRIWNLDCPTLRRLRTVCMAKSSTIRNDHSARERHGTLGSDKGPPREAVSPSLDRLIHDRIPLA